MPDLSSSLRDLIERSARPFDVDAIVRARRRHRRVRRGSVAGVVVVIAAVVTGSVLARPANEPKIVSVGGSGDAASSAAEAAATRAALAQVTIVSPGGGSSTSETFSTAPQIHLTDPVSGSTRTIPFPVPGVRGWSVPFVARGSQVVMLVDQHLVGGNGVGPVGSTGGARLGPVGLTGPGQPDAPALSAIVARSTFGQWQSVGYGGEVSLALAGTEPNAVWLVGADVTEYFLGGSAEARGPYRLTRDRTPVAVVTGGLLTVRPSGSASPAVYEVWDPATGRAIRQLDIRGSLMAASASFVAWVASGCNVADRCELHVTDVRTGRERLVAPPRGAGGWSNASFSPDGTRLALATVAISIREALSQYFGGVVPAGTRAAEIEVLDPASGRTTTRSVRAWKGALSPTWSPDGSVVFFTRDRSHLGYFNATYRHSSVHDVSVPDADSYVILAKPAAPSPAVTKQRWEYNGSVVGDRLHSPKLCVYAVAGGLSAYEDGCGGPLVAGWHSKKLSGTFHLVGTYDGNVFTLTQPPDTPVTTTLPTTPPTSPPPGTPTPTDIGFPSGCPTPPGGWRVTDPARVTFATYTAVTDAAQHEPGYVSTWVGPYTSYPGVVDAKLAVLNFAFTGNLDAHRQALSAIYGGPICVVQRGTHTESQLLSIVHQIFGAFGSRLGLQMISGGPDPFDGAVTVEAIAVTPAQRAAVDHRFGAGVVHLNSRLTLLP